MSRRKSPPPSARPGNAIPRRRAIARLAGIAATVAAPLVLPGRLFGDTAPSKKITLGFVGLGNEGYGHNLMAFLQENDARAVAVCDVFASRRQRGRGTVEQKYSAKGCTEIADFRDLIARKDVDAVVISTPDHWHVPIALLALEAGKDVFCEKPTLTIAEGRKLVETVSQHKAVFQVGIEDRSTIYYYRMAELVRNGAIGKLQTIHVKLPAGSAFPIEKPAPIPSELNWEMWLGPAAFHPFTPTRTEAMHWRQVRDYSGGLLTDWGAHLIDTAQVANCAELSGPVEVEGTGTIPKDSMATTFVAFKLRYRYANDVELFVESGGVGIRFDGTEGWIGNDGWLGRLEGTSTELLRRKYPRQGNKIWPMPPNEQRNFLDCVKSRQPTTYTAEADQRLSTTMHIGNIAMQLERKLKWDPQSESFLGDEAANALRSRPARDDWMKK
jgi:myo-inositol 2-dehydrogenase / D-chiro-inositol 1-dehydrogenase